MKKIATAGAMSALLIAGVIAPAIAADGDAAPLTGAVSGIAYVDSNGNGTYDAGVDKPAAGTLLSVVDAEGNPVADAEGRKLSAGTDKDGSYVIPGVTHGHKLVFSVNLEGYKSSMEPQTISFTEDKLDMEINWPLDDPNAPVSPDAGSANGKESDGAQSDPSKVDGLAPGAGEKGPAPETAKPIEDGKDKGADADKGQSDVAAKTETKDKGADKSKDKGDSAQSGKAKPGNTKGAKPGLAKTGATAGFLAMMAGATGALGAVALRARKR